MSEERAVQQVLARYVRGTDARDGAAVAAVFTEDGRVEISYNNSGKSEALGELVGRVISRKDSSLHSRPTFYVSCSLIRAESANLFRVRLRCLPPCGSHHPCAAMLEAEVTQPGVFVRPASKRPVELAI